MTIRERHVVDRPAAKVWPYIIRPKYFAQWNTKICSMDATGGFGQGQPFTTHYWWNNKAIQCATVATEVRAGRVLELRHSNLTGPGIRPGMEILERITLLEAGGKSAVTKVVTIKNHGMPWVLIPIVWFVANFGARVGPDLLKTLCERGVATAWDRLEGVRIRAPHRPRAPWASRGHQQTNFVFLLFGGVGASYFVTERTALFAGYRLQHVSNAGTDSPNMGINSHTGVVGVSIFFR